MLPEHTPDFCQHDDCDQPPTCWVSYHDADGAVVGAIFTCDPHQGEYIDQPAAGDGNTEGDH